MHLCRHLQLHHVNPDEAGSTVLVQALVLVSIVTIVKAHLRVATGKFPARIAQRS